MRISGLSSGFDVENTVAKLMEAHRIPLNKLIQNKQILEWQRDDYRSMNSKILELRNSSFNLTLEGTFQPRKASSSNEAVITASATSNAIEGVYSLSVTNLAVAASLTSSGGLGGDSSKTLGDAAGINLTADTTFTIGGEKGTATFLAKTTDTIATLVANVNGKSSVTGVKLTYDSTLDRLFFVSSTTGLATKVDMKTQSATLLGDGAGTVGLKFAGVTSVATGQTVVGSRVFASSTELLDASLTGTNTKTLRIAYNGNNYDVAIANTKTVGQFIDEINGSAFGKTGVSAYLDSAGKLAFFNPDDTKPLVFSDTTTPAPAVGAEITTLMGLVTPTTTSALSYTTVNSTAAYKVANPTTNSVTGTNANITFNGVSGSYATNTFSVAGMTLTAKTGGGATANITVTQDVDTAFESIKKFVEKYNETIAAVNAKIDEKRYRDFAPLTDQQRTDLKEDDVKRWDEKAKSGLLRGDSILKTSLSTLRSSLSKSVSGIASGDYKQLFEIGITSGTYSEQGKLYIDEAKLKDAIATKPDQVKKLFIADDGLTTTDNGDGLAVRIYNSTKDIMSRLTDKAGTSSSATTQFLIGKRMNDLDKKALDLGRRLEALETRYYNQFTTMESALNRMNAQSAQLTSSLGGS